MAPALAPHCVGGLICRNDGYARPFHALDAFRRKACSLGVEYHASARVDEVEHNGNEWRASTPKGEYQAPVLVNCAGAWAGRVAATLGEPVPLKPGAPMLMIDLLDIALLQQRIEQAGAAGPLLFMAAYVLATVLFLPGSVLTLAGGALFGPVWGALYNLTGATIGAALAFLVARYLASAWVEQKSAGRLKQLKEGVEKEGWRFVAFVRLVPLFPFNLLNYALGLTRIKFLHYLLATYICMLPGAIAFTYIGYAGREAAAGGEALIQKGLLALALLALVAFLPRFIKRLRNTS